METQRETARRRQIEMCRATIWDNLTDEQLSVIVRVITTLPDRDLGFRQEYPKEAGDDEGNG